MLAKLDVEKDGRDTSQVQNMSGLLEKSVRIDFCNKGCLREWGERIVTGSWNSPHMKIETLKNDHYRRSRTKAGTNDDDMRAEEFAGY